MIRIYIEKDIINNKLIEIEKKQFHYLKNVMRIGENDIFFVFNGRDGEYSAKLNGKLIEPIEKLRENEGFGCDIWLLFAPVKKDNTDFIIQKGTELGVSLFQPIQTEYTNTSRTNREKMCLNAIEATEQCRRLLIPQVEDIKKLNDTLKSFPPDRVLYFLDEDMSGISPKSIYEQSENKKVAFLIGPEGGFSKKEREFIKSYPFVKVISLKGSILRAETAVVSAISSWHTVCGEWS